MQSNNECNIRDAIGFVTDVNAVLKLKEEFSSTWSSCSRLSCCGRTSSLPVALEALTATHPLALPCVTAPPWRQTATHRQTHTHTHINKIAGSAKTQMADCGKANNISIHTVMFMSSFVYILLLFIKLLIIHYILLMRMKYQLLLCWLIHIKVTVSNIRVKVTRVRVRIRVRLLCWTDDLKV